MEIISKLKIDTEKKKNNCLKIFQVSATIFVSEIIGTL